MNETKPIRCDRKKKKKGEILFFSEKQKRGFLSWLTIVFLLGLPSFLLAGGFGQVNEEKRQPLVVLTNEDLERGYIAHWGQRHRPFQPAGPIELTMGADEFESLELGMLALKDMGKVTVHISTPGWPPDAIEVRTQEGIAIEGVRLDDGSYGLVESNTLAMPLAAHKAFWFILRSHQVKPGCYELTITLHPEYGPVRSLPVVVEVVDVHQASRDEASLYLYYTLNYTSSARYLQILRDHYLRHVEIHFGFRPWFERVSVKRDGPVNSLPPLVDSTAYYNCPVRWASIRSTLLGRCGMTIGLLTSARNRRSSNSGRVTSSSLYSSIVCINWGLLRLSTIRWTSHP